MFLSKGYQTFPVAVIVYCGDNEDYDIFVERLGSALASEELVADGIVVGAAESDDDPPEMGRIIPIRPQIWRTSRARNAVAGSKPTERLYQDGLVLFPIIQESMLDAWHKTGSEGQRAMSASELGRTRSVPGLSYGVHALPAGYVAFDQISNIARIWAKRGNIDPDLMLLLDPLDTDAMTEALAAGSLRAFGINKRTGAIVPLPPSIWRMEVSGAPQSIWAIGGHDVLASPDGDPCLPVITRADLARSFEAKEIPPDPDELPEGWQPASPLGRLKFDSCGVIDVHAWMRGLAQGYKILGNTLKRNDAVKVATKHLRCTTRQAEAAYEALPYPELRNPPRTPPE
jgi:hypothetical protein